MARAALGWTLQDLAERAGVNLNTVARFEAGREVKSGTIDRFESVFSAAGVTLTYVEGAAGIQLSQELTRRVGRASGLAQPKSKKRSQKPK